jgi:hypothetical protein
VIFSKEDPDQAAVIELREQIGERINALAKQGMQIQVDRPAAILEAILDAVMGEGELRIAWERQWALGVSDMLDNAEAQIRQAKLTAGVAMDPRVQNQIRR